MALNKRTIKILMRKKASEDEVGYIEVESSVIRLAQFDVKKADKAVKDTYGPKYQFIRTLKEGEEIPHHGGGHKPKPRGPKKGWRDKWPTAPDD